MPYIDKHHRLIFDKFVDYIVALIPQDDYRAGTLNYVITTLILKVLGSSPRYKDYNEAVGVLESVKLEMYRRKVSVYEDKKASEAGDVF